MASPVSPPENHTCVMTIQAARPGGIPTVVDWWHTFLDGWGQQPTTVYAAFDDTDISRRERLRQTFTHWRVHKRPEHPNPTLAVAALPLPLWLFFAVPQFVAGSLINRFGQHVVAGGALIRPQGEHLLGRVVDTGGGHACIALGRLLAGPQEHIKKVSE